jgi:transposase-like protein
MWKKYDDEVKRVALQKVFDGQSVRSVAEELGVNESLIHNWKRAALSKVTTIECGYIRVWATKVRLNLRWSYKLKTEEMKDSFLSKKTVLHIEIASLKNEMRSI